MTSRSARRTLFSEGGSGSILAMAILATVLAMASFVVPLYMVFLAQQRAAGAADTAALAAADVARGIASGIPCNLADILAAANGARLTGCETDGAIVTVRVEIVVLGLVIPGSATAGPPGSAPK
jgi:secretion/DNA translocation related TadE-like protein